MGKAPLLVRLDTLLERPCDIEPYFSMLGEIIRDVYALQRSHDVLRGEWEKQAASMAPGASSHAQWVLRKADKAREGS